ncbi:MAG: hypothetical protein LBV23_01895 [Deltaproteobacteria bacterium]|jgi:hypothetical protein|nr:hypothetical protein [Deltaproteobacteria bacterium]
MGRKITELPLKLAKEICLKLIERGLLAASKLPSTLETSAKSLSDLLSGSPSPPALSLAGQLTLRLIERGRIGSCAAAIETVVNLTETMTTLSSQAKSAQISQALTAAAELTSKLLETNSISFNQISQTLSQLTQAALRAIEPN